MDPEGFARCRNRRFARAADSWHAIFLRAMRFGARAVRAASTGSYRFRTSDTTLPLVARSPRTEANQRGHAALRCSPRVQGAARSAATHGLPRSAHVWRRRAACERSASGRDDSGDLVSARRAIAGRSRRRRNGPGLPGVLLGHNERIAWASTNADMTTASIFERDGSTAGRGGPRRSTCGLRATCVSHAIALRGNSRFPTRAILRRLRWYDGRSTRREVRRLLRLSRSIARAAWARRCEFPRGIAVRRETFVVADRSGAVAYHVAGLVPNHPSWGRYVHPPGLALGLSGDSVRAASRTAVFPLAILVTANNKPYGKRYPYRLSAQFEAPRSCLSHRELLRARRRYDAAYFARMQLDTFSPIDFEIARDAVRFARANTAQRLHCKPSRRWRDGTAVIGPPRAPPRWSTRCVSPSLRVGRRSTRV